LRSLFREFVAGKAAMEDAHDHSMRAAWTIASLQRTKRIPDIKTLLTKRDVNQNARQNAKQMRTSLQLISEAYRLPLRKAKRKH
jgi:hypothetical protein